MEGDVTYIDSTKRSRTGTVTERTAQNKGMHMHKPVSTTALIVGALGTGGYMLGQISSVTPTSAASVAKKYVAKKHATKTPIHKKHTAGTSSVAHADGEVVSVKGDTITVKPDAAKAGNNEYAGVTAIKLSGATKYSTGHRSVATTTRPIITAGQYIVAEGKVSPDGKSLDAMLVSFHSRGHGGGRHAFGPHADGTVTGVTANTISIKADTDKADTNKAGTNEYTGVTTIKLTSATKYQASHDSAATTTKPTITIGEYVVAEGTPSAGGTTLTATTVSIRPAGPRGH
ncbi:MAG: hypothetical protein NVSMB52_00060 [Chloroflexota bacterium]